MRMLLLPLLALAACSGGPANEIAPVDIGNAAGAAQGAIDNYAALPDDSPVRVATPPLRPVAMPSASPAPAPSPSPDVVSEAPFAPDSAQGAAIVVQTYYALLEAGKYQKAWRVWDDEGRASGMNAAAFAASFAKYREYHAEIAAPGEIGAGAGQRYVMVPVRVYGRLKAGNRAFAMAGLITLHRAADIDGASAEQRSWRISGSDVRPRPDEAAPGSR